MTGDGDDVMEMARDSSNCNVFYVLNLYATHLSIEGTLSDLTDKYSIFFKKKPVRKAY